MTAAWVRDESLVEGVGVVFATDAMCIRTMCGEST